MAVVPTAMAAMAAMAAMLWVLVLGACLFVFHVYRSLPWVRVST